MKWNEMSVFRKVVSIIWILCLIAGITLTVLDAMNIVASIDILEDIIDCALCLFAGIICWKKKSLLPIVLFALSGLKFIFLFI